MSMTAATSSSHFVDAFSQVIQAQVDNLTDDQKKTLCEMILSQLTPATSPVSDNQMATTQTPVAQTPQIAVVQAVDRSLQGAAARTLTRARERRARSGGLRTLGRKKVNAFMVFRAFYSPLLNGLPQKVRSGLLSKMWRSEPRHNHFHLLGDAYSVIRDSTEGAGITLNNFLEVAHGFVGIIPVDQYLRKAGWTLVDNGIVAVPFNSAEVLAEFPTTVAASTGDVTAHCHLVGLISRYIAPDTVPFALGHGHMAFAVNHAATNNEQSPIEVPDFNILDTPVSADSSWADEALQLLRNPHLPSGYNPSMIAVTFDQQMTYNQTSAAVHWNPEVSPPILGFDPTLVQNEFDPFNFDLDVFFDSDL